MRSRKAYANRNGILNGTLRFYTFLGAVSHGFWRRWLYQSRDYLLKIVGFWVTIVMVVFDHSNIRDKRRSRYYTLQKVTMKNNLDHLLLVMEVER